ncbi:hypothetical protein CLOP_g17418 [Closterium sp. NIES-67]|nr:hypothetical protein CLOP_g17418 [Closterium sp. NIES-67]
MARPAEIFPPLLDRLNTPHPSVQRFTVDAIFARFAAPSTAPQTCTPARDALTACLTHATSAVVDQSVTALCGLVQSGHCKADEALAHLLAALPAKQQEGEREGGGGKEWRGGRGGEVQWRWTWSTHPFTRLLETRDETHLPLLHHLALLLLSPPPLSSTPTATTKSSSSSNKSITTGTRNARSSGSSTTTISNTSSTKPSNSASSSSDRALLFSSLLPFLCRALLPAPSPPSRLRFKAALHTRLVHMAATSADLFQPITGLLVSLLPWHMLSSAADRETMLACTGDLMDLAYAVAPLKDMQEAQSQIYHHSQTLHTESIPNQHVHALASLSSRLSACALALSLELQAAGSNSAAGAAGAGAGAAPTAASAAAGLASSLFLIQKASLLRARIEAQIWEQKREEEEEAVRGGRGETRREGEGVEEGRVEQTRERADEVEVLGLMRLLLCGLPADEEHATVLAVLQQSLTRLSLSRHTRLKGAADSGDDDIRLCIPLLLLPLLHLLSFPSPSLKLSAAHAINACLAATASRPLFSQQQQQQQQQAMLGNQQQLWLVRQQQQQWRHPDLWHMHQFAQLFICLTSHSRFKNHPIASPQWQPGTWHSPETWANEPVPRQHEHIGSAPGVDMDDTAADVAGSQAVINRRGEHGCHVSGSDRWLVALQQQLIQIRKETVRKAGRETSAGSGLSQSLILSLAALLLPLSTLHHPSPSLRSSSLLALSRLASCEPLWALSLLPPVLWSLSHVAQGGARGKGEACLQVLCVLPSLARHWLAAGPVVQVLTKLAGQKSRPLLASVALRLLQQAWAITDRIFPSLQPLLLPQSLSTPSTGRIDPRRDAASEAVVLAAAASIRGVCRHDTDRAVRLVLSVQAAIESRHPLVAAFGLDALAALCAADAVDFFTAWKVVARSHPSLPTHPITAACWCHLLQSAALDAAAYPDATRGIMEGLWEAARKGREEGEVIEERSGGRRGEEEWRQTRASAYTALAAFSVDDVTDAWPYPSTHLVQAYLSEPCPSVRQAMQPLLAKLAHYQHRTRPRGRSAIKAAAAGGGEGAGGDMASAATSSGAPGAATWRSNKLLAALPRLLCPESFGGRKGKDGLDVPAAALLLVPPPPPELPAPPSATSAPAQSTSTRSRSTAGSARQARLNLEKALKERDSHFHRIFLEASQLLGRPAFYPLVLSSLAAWTHFMRQWYRARCRLLHATAAATAGAATAAAGPTAGGAAGVTAGTAAAATAAESAGRARGGGGDAATAAAVGLWEVVTGGLESGVPVEAENSALALAALCQALPPSLHRLVAGWAFALALGAVGGCLHPTDAHMRLRIAILLTKESTALSALQLLSPSGPSQRARWRSPIRRLQKAAAAALAGALTQQHLQQQQQQRYERSAP